MSISFKRGLQLLKFLKVSLDDIDTTGELEKYITHEKPTTPKPKGPVVIDERYKVCRNCIYITKQLGSNINDIYPYYCKKHNFKEYPIDSFRCNDWEESEKSKKERECGFRRIK